MNPSCCTINCLNQCPTDTPPFRTGPKAWLSLAWQALGCSFLRQQRRHLMRAELLGLAVTKREKTCLCEQEHK